MERLWEGRRRVAVLLGGLPGLLLAGSAWGQAVVQPEITVPQAIAPELPPQAPAQQRPQPAPGTGPGAGPGPGPLGRAGAMPDQNQPVTFTADEVEYDRDRALVTARGHVEAWQGERILRADEFTYDRNTGVATVRGNVQLLEADGQVVFAQSAVLSNQMRDGVLEGLRGLLAQNGRVAAAGARRTGGTIFDLSRVVYSSCNLCQDDPLAPPLWQVRARTATLDQTEHQVRYRDATLQFWGIPVLYTPYLQHPDGQAPRQSGFLSPSFGYTRFLGAFTELPYYWAIDDSSDMVITPLIGTRQAPNLGIEYRRRFNFGEIELQGSAGYLSGQDTTDRGFGGHIFSKGRFTIDENWRAGFDINRASSEEYLRIFRFGARRVLTSSVFTEGFWGPEMYARFDTRLYQGLRATDDISQIPFVLPNTYFDWHSDRDALGGRWTIDTWNFAVYRDKGTDTGRLSSRINYDLPRTDRFGSVWTFRMQADVAAYTYSNLNLPPNNSTVATNGSEATGNIRLALDWRLPLIRSAGEWGSQLVEPRVQLVTGPMTGSQSRIPNEDSIDFEFTDANLFALNRFPGRDRQEGGTRVDAALRAAWFFPNGGQVEGLAGRSYRIQSDGGPFYTGSGVENRASDYVARLRLAPVPWLEFGGRGRFDGETGARRFLDLSTTVRFETRTSITAGYLYTNEAPYLNPVRQRDEVALAVGQSFTNWRFSVSGRYDIETGRPVVLAATAAYEDECFLIEGRFVKRFAIDPTTNNLYPANTLLLVRLSFKTIGDFAFRAI